MQPLYQARDRIEAQLLRDFLDRHSIETLVFGDYLSGAVGELPADIYPTLWLINDADLERARALLMRFQSETGSRHAAAPWACPVCGEEVQGDFDLCWNCGQGRPGRQ